MAAMKKPGPKKPAIKRPAAKPVQIPPKPKPTPLETTRFGGVFSVPKKPKKTIY